MKKSSTWSALGCITILFLSSACTKQATIEPVTRVEVKTVQITKPAPIIPPVDQLKLRSVNWIIITPENIDEKFASVKSGDMVLFALTKDGYEALSLNNSDVRANIDQYKKILAIYKHQF